MITSKSPRKVLKLAYALGVEVLPKYFSPFSRHAFTKPQLFACLVLREHQKKSFRGLERLRTIRMLAVLVAVVWGVLVLAIMTSLDRPRAWPRWFTRSGVQIGMYNGRLSIVRVRRASASAGTTVGLR